MLPNEYSVGLIFLLGGAIVDRSPYGLKEIKNWDKASVCDIETDNLLEDLTKIHIVGIQLHGKKNVTYIKGSDHARIRKMLEYHIENEIPIAGHNFITFDVPAMEKVLKMDLSKLLVLDTLALSWYLNVGRRQHSIEALSSDYDTDIKKYQVDPEDWENLSWEDATERVKSDVLLNRIIWEDFKSRLIDMYTKVKNEVDFTGVGGQRTSHKEEIYLDRKIGQSVEEWVNQILTFLMYKADTAALKEKTKWECDVDLVHKSIKELQEQVDFIREQLEKEMPAIPRYVKRNKPKTMFKKNGELSKAGERWENVQDLYENKTKNEQGHPMVIYEGRSMLELVEMKPPNLNSHQQVKDWLFSMGWEPKTFNIRRDDKAFSAWIESRPQEGAHHSEWSKWKDAKPKDTYVPQVAKDGDEGKELCESVEILAKKVPAIKLYANYATINHRISVLNGFLNNLIDGKWLIAGVGGYTNTLRVMHRTIVNLPSAGRPFAEAIRASLVATGGYTLLGSDLSSLEDRIKLHAMIPHDPELVAEMSSDTFDPHTKTAVSVGLITEAEEAFYKWKKDGIDEGTVNFDRYKKLSDKEQQELFDNIDGHRAVGKTINYASVYQAGPNTIARTVGCSVAEAKEMLEAYWGLFWSVKAIAEEQVLIECAKGLKWLVNPVSGFCYNIRTEKDIFSTFCQGTGSFMFDMWVCEILHQLDKQFGQKTLTADFHDEIVLRVRDTEGSKKFFDKLIKDSIQKVSDYFKLRRELGCDVAFGKRYSEIH